MGMVAEAGQSPVGQDAFGGAWHRDSPESDDAEVVGPDEDKGFEGLAFDLLSIPSCPVATVQHLQLGQGQAELYIQGAATSAKRSSRE